MTTNIDPRREIDREVAFAWEQRLMAQERLEEADANWTRQARRIRRFVNKGRCITDRPAFGDALGEITLKWKGQEALVHIKVHTADGKTDTIRFPLAWVGMPRMAWMDLLRQQHAGGATWDAR